MDNKEKILIIDGLDQAKHRTCACNVQSTWNTIFTIPICQAFNKRLTQDMPDKWILVTKYEHVHIITYHEIPINNDINVCNVRFTNLPAIEDGMCTQSSGLDSFCSIPIFLVLNFVVDKSSPGNSQEHPCEQKQFDATIKDLLIVLQITPAIKGRLQTLLVKLLQQQERSKISPGVYWTLQKVNDPGGVSSFPKISTNRIPKQQRCPFSRKHYPGKQVSASKDYSIRIFRIAQPQDGFECERRLEDEFEFIIRYGNNFSSQFFLQIKIACMHRLNASVQKRRDEISNRHWSRAFSIDLKSENTNTPYGGGSIDRASKLRNKLEKSKFDAKDHSAWEIQALKHQGEDDWGQSAFCVFSDAEAKAEAGVISRVQEEIGNDLNPVIAQNEEEVDGIIYDRPRDPPGQRSIYIPPGNEKSEPYRLSTFGRYPQNVPVTPTDLAAAGFYYTGYKDRVKCFSCGLCVENWVVGDDVKHARWHREACDLANGRECGNIPIARGIFSQLLAGRPGVNVPEGNRVAGNVPQPARSSTRTPMQPSARNEEPMEEGEPAVGTNISSSHSATPMPPQTRFLGQDFEFATILSREHEIYLRSTDLRSEANRLETFHRWPSGARTVPAAELAKAGFFYLGNLDRTQCFSCGGVLRNWTLGDNVVNEHRRHFAHCKMVRGMETMNAPIHTPERARAQTTIRLQEPADPDESQLPGLREMFTCLQPVNPHMQSEARRLETFDQRWPGIIAATPEQISKAGFFYLGERDRVKCWYCNGGLQNWDINDEPWTEHAKWFPTCEFILQRKGPDFVHRVVAAFPNLRRPTIRQAPLDIPPNEELGQRYPSEPARRRPSPPPPIIDPQEDDRKLQLKVEEAMHTEIVQGVLGMGCEERAVKRAVRRKIQETGSDFNSADELLEALNVQGANTDEEEVPLQSAGQARIRMTGETRIQLGSNEPSTSQMTTVKRASSNSPTEPQAPMDAESNASSLTPSEDPSPSMQQRLRELQEERMCKICLDKPADIVFVPCGHLCCCYNCALALRKCPMCRKKIDKSIRTYLA